MTIMLLATKIGTGQRTTLAPMRRYNCAFAFAFGSNSPNKLPTVSTAGTRVRAAAMVSTMAMATAGPMVWK